MKRDNHSRKTRRFKSTQAHTFVSSVWRQKPKISVCTKHHNPACLCLVWCHKKTFFTQPSRNWANTKQQNKKISECRKKKNLSLTWKSMQSYRNQPTMYGTVEVLQWLLIGKTKLIVSPEFHVLGTRAIWSDLRVWNCEVDGHEVWQVLFFFHSSTFSTGCLSPLPTLDK